MEGTCTNIGNSLQAITNAMTAISRAQLHIDHYASVIWQLVGDMETSENDGEDDAIKAQIREMATKIRRLAD